MSFDDSTVIVQNCKKERQVFQWSEIEKIRQGTRGNYEGEFILTVRGKPIVLEYFNGMDEFDLMLRKHTMWRYASVRRKNTYKAL